MIDFQKIKFAIVMILFIVSRNAHSQERKVNQVMNPPVNTELLFSNRGLAFQMIVDKKFNSYPKFGIFSVTYLVGEWGEDSINDYMTQSSVTYEIMKGLKLATGFHVTTVKGMRPIAGLIYTVSNQTWLLVANTRIDFSKDTNLEGLFILEFKPEINEKWRFYSRIQSLYEYNTAIDSQTRSYIMARAGLSYKEFSFGLGSNLDYYGAEKININSFGAFLGILLP